ncbi:MAG: zinc dependent phospholipase C family protein [Bacteroidota bacterium]
MSFTKNIVLSFVLVGILLTCGSWGFLIHKTTVQLAVYKLPKQLQPFFYKQMKYLVANAGRADTRRNTDSTEAPRHFIDLEKFGDNAAYAMPFDWDSAQRLYTRDSLLIYGYVPYEIVRMKTKLTEAFRSGVGDSILFYATDLAHYIGDAHVPLHTTENYDGQLSDQKGIHSLWESMIPEILIGNYQLYDKHQATYLQDPAGAIWEAIRSSYKLVPEVLAKEKEVTGKFPTDKKYRMQMRRGKEVRSYTSEFAKAYAAALGSSINEQLLKSANLIADFWFTAWVDAGRPEIGDRFTKMEKKVFKNERKVFERNELLKDSLLLSKKEPPRAAE